MLDKWIARLNRALEKEGARAALLGFIHKMNGRPDRVNGIRLAEIIHRRRLPNAEILLTLQKWLESTEVNRHR